MRKPGAARRSGWAGPRKDGDVGGCRAGRHPRPDGDLDSGGSGLPAPAIAKAEQRQSGRVFDPAGVTRESDYRRYWMGPELAAIFSRRAIRSAIGGWVEKRFARP